MNPILELLRNLNTVQKKLEEGGNGTELHLQHLGHRAHIIEALRKEGFRIAYSEHIGRWVLYYGD